MRVKAPNFHTWYVNDGAIQWYHVVKPHVRTQRDICEHCTHFATALLSVSLVMSCHKMSHDPYVWLHVLSALISFLGFHSPILQMWVMKNTALRAADDFHSTAKLNCWPATLNYMRTCDVHIMANKHDISFLCLKYANHHFRLPVFAWLKENWEGARIPPNWWVSPVVC